MTGATRERYLARPLPYAPRDVVSYGGRGLLKLGNARIIGVTLALLVGVLAVAAPWCLAPRCPEMMTSSDPMASVACAPMAGHQLSSTCGDMHAGTPVTAVASAKAPAVPDLVALAPSGAPLPVLTAVRAVTIAPAEDPPRLVLDTSRLRI